MEEKPSIKYYLTVTLKGIAMGAADVVPGVSGGTIAFITGIYEKLLSSIKSIDLNAFKLLLSKGVIAFWKHINGTFLFSLVLGIGISIFSLAKSITFALANYPMYVWAFFFGLILASIYILVKKVSVWKAGEWISLLMGTVIAYLITIISPTNGPDALWYIFVSGFVGICAMILPGISGSFILLLMGSYTRVMTAVKEFDVVTMIVFIFGAIVGLASFSRVLTWLFKKHHNIAVVFLTGFMIGSLNKVWPWQNVTSWVTDSHGTQQPLTTQSVSPWDYTGAFDSLQVPHVGYVLALAVLGFLLIYIIEKLASKKIK